MNCAYEHCIYNKDFQCILDEVNIDSLGRCDDFIKIRIDDKLLEAEKKRQLTQAKER